MLRQDNTCCLGWNFGGFRWSECDQGPCTPTQVAEWAGHSVDVLLRIYAKCIAGQDELAKRRIDEALRQSHTVTASKIAEH